MIKIISVRNFITERKLKGPVSSPQIFLGNSFNFHPKGLMSEEIFGIDGSLDRRKSMSWIDLNCQVIHPFIYELISKGIEKKIPMILSGKKTYDLNPDGYLIENTEGSGQISGMTSFVKALPNLKFTNPEGTRGQIIKVFYDNIKNNEFLMDRLLVISPAFREVEIMKRNNRDEIVTDDLTTLYKRIIEVATQASMTGGKIFDAISYQMQLLLVDLYDMIRLLVSKKHGLVRRLMLGHRVDFSGRSVITPNPNLNIGEVGIPFKMICSLFEPYLVYGLTNSPYAKSIPDDFHIEGRKYLGKGETEEEEDVEDESDTDE